MYNIVAAAPLVCRVAHKNVWSLNKIFKTKITNNSELFQVGEGWDTSSSSLENDSNYVKITLYCANRVKIANSSELFQIWERWYTISTVENSSIYVNKITLYCANRVKITNSSELFQDGEGDETHHHHLLKFLQFM